MTVNYIRIWIERSKTTNRDSIRIFIPEGLALIKFWSLSLIFSVLFSEIPKFRGG